MKPTTTPTSHPLSRLRPAARILGQPTLLLATAGAIAVTLRSDLPLGLAALAILAGALFYLFATERLVPFRDPWQPAPAEWRRDSLYFGLNGLVSTALTLGTSVLAISLAADTTGLALGAQIPLAYLLAAFVGYWTHRLGHEVDFLWQLHGVHHSPDKVNAWNNNVIHFLDLVFQNGSVLVALLLAGFSPEAVFAVTAFNQVVGFIDHANADFRMGPLNYLIGTPEQHRLHHSLDLDEAGNYSALPALDLLFGTFTWRPGREPARVGIVDAHTFPPASSIVRNALHPWRAWTHRKPPIDAPAPSFPAAPKGHSDAA